MSSCPPVWVFFFCEESGCQAKGIRQGLHKGAEVLALVGNSLGLELPICEMESPLCYMYHSLLAIHLCRTHACQAACTDTVSARPLGVAAKAGGSAPKRGSSGQPPPTLLQA